ncbi:epidermal growth factor-like protein 6 isoform X1 [Terrapene carolina triunguis]|uniref:epidermal growth factor-like protein 6 isoform X1 n=1 Tax=Terrapene triunguis TaxID=2587831 RepID=UPI000CF00911|nr:epidermal growth factor-like protein 6 isoform X1 [Terrapene carolina triunguis]XP_026505390.1 epidermal growth factor-like protein 6 isoform X1 [Terrapene carolina triunguis]
MGPIACSALLATLLPFVTRGFADTASSRGHRQLMSVSQPGVCRYGSKLECCYGWRKNKGHCEATCEHGCKYGECVGPNKCNCFPGFTGKTCSQDTNECGLKPRPCKHRCMNTHGSYKCYCLNGYMLMPDGTCANSRTCAMVNCQYGCEEVKKEVRCLCPSTGLQLGPNGRTCIDIDECSTGKAICSYNRRCVNTFGSYYCKCQIGYELKYVSGHYDCVDINECAASIHKCNVHAGCLNTQGSFKCKCKQGYRGSGFECSVIPENLVKEVTRIPGAIKDTIKKLLAHKSSVKKHEEIKNVIPEPAMTPASKVHLPSFDYEDGVYIGGTYDVEEKETEDAVEEEQEEEQEDLENQIGHEQSLRGDVFIPKVKEAAAFGPVLAQRKVPVSKPEQEVDCSFSQGICNWKQDTDDDFDWNPADRDNGDGYYMAVPAFVGHKKNVGRLKLLLTDLKPKRSYCLIFSYRLAGDRVGKLRVFLGSHRSAPAWEQSRGKDERWRTGKIEMLQGAETTKNIIFESERGKGKTGEIGVDTVSLVSGLCPKDHLIMDI